MASKSSAVNVAIVADNSSLLKSLDHAESKLGSFAKSVAKTAAAAGVAAAVGLGVLAKASVDAASRAQQSMGATETVFGKFADNVKKTSNNAATALGLSANAYRENANVLGALLGNQGVSQDKLAGKTRGLIKTGADLAATFGGTTTQAVEALASAFKGEFDPLEQYGVSIKQSTINTEAFRVAGVETQKAFDELTDSQKAAAKQTATTNLLTKQTTKSQGAFARETDTLAHQQQVLGAQWDNLKAKLGKALLPAITNVFKSLNNDLMPALSKLASKYLPQVRKALDGWTRDLDVTQLLGNLSDALSDIDWDDFTDGVSDIADAFKDLEGGSTADLNDAIDVLGTTFSFFADHLDTLRAALPYIVAGFVALKGAQTLNEIAGRNSLIGLGLQLAATNRLTAANRQLAASMGQVTAAQRGTAGAVATTTTGITRLGAAAKGAAGLAGLGLLTAGAAESNEGLATLELTAGGAAAGFAVGGPLGAAIGGLGGLMAGLVFKMDDAAEASREAYKKIAAVDPIEVAEQKFEDLKDTLDQVTGAYTENTRAAVFNQLEQDGLIDTAAKYGIGARALVDAALGHKSVLQDITPLLASYEQKIIDADAAQVDLARSADNFTDTGFTKEAQAQWEALEKQKKAAQTSIAELEKMPAALRDDAREIRAASAATADYSGELRGLPKKLRTKIQTEGLEPTRKNVAKLATLYRLTPKQVKTLIDATGVDATVKRIKRVQDKLAGVGRTRADFSEFKQSTSKAMNDLEASTGHGGERIGKAAKDGFKKGAHADTSGMESDVRNGLERVKNEGHSGAVSAGGSLKSGFIVGIAGLGSALESIMRSAVRQALAGARAEADAHSPSRETIKLGLDLAAGLAIGVTRGSDGIDSALRKLTDRVTKLLDKQLAARQKQIRKRLDGKAEAAALKKLEAHWKKHVRVVQQQVKKLDDAIRENGKRQDAVDARLDKARANLKKLEQAHKDYRAAIKGSAIDYASVINPDVAFNPKVMLAEMQHRLDKIRQFNAILQDLVKKGLSSTIIKQLADAGVEGGLATAFAIQQGGQSAIDEFTRLQEEINKAAGALGTTAADELYNERIAAAEEHVKKLEARIHELERRARKLLRELSRAVAGKLTSKQLEALRFDASKVSPPGSSGAVTASKMTQLSAAAPAPAVPVANTYQITVNAPVGASPADIGRTITTYIDAYEKSGGRRRS